MSVSQKVQTYINDKGLTYITLAQKAGIPPQTLRAILDGKQTMYAEDLRGICIALNVNAETFIVPKGA